MLGINREMHANHQPKTNNIKKCLLEKQLNQENTSDKHDRMVQKHDKDGLKLDKWSDKLHKRGVKLEDKLKQLDKWCDKLHKRGVKLDKMRNKLDKDGVKLMQKLINKENTDNEGLKHRQKRYFIENEGLKHRQKRDITGKWHHIMHDIMVQALG